MEIRKLVGSMGNTLENSLNDELFLIQGFLNAIKVLERVFGEIKEVDKEVLIGLMVKEAMISSKGSLNPEIVSKRAEEYISKFI